jgi:hypothetical protein
MGNLSKKLSFVLLAILITGGGIFILSRKPKTIEGIKILSDQGRNHVPIGTAVEYNSNPPTSGPHYAQWEKPGIYSKVLQDGNLVHSLEHGYIVISYNCTKSLIFNFSRRAGSRFAGQFSIFKRVYAHETDEPHEEIPATDSADVKTDSVSEWKNNPDCQKLVEEIKQVTKKTGMDRLIVVPRPNLDTPIALTAWRKLLKLENVNEDKIVNFVKEFRNRGPEKTME